jgi:hypothetical protein
MRMTDIAEPAAVKAVIGESRTRIGGRMSLWKQMNQSSVRENITEASQLMVRGFW